MRLLWEDFLESLHNFNRGLTPLDTDDDKEDA